MSQTKDCFEGTNAREVAEALHSSILSGIEQARKALSVLETEVGGKATNPCTPIPFPLLTRLSTVMDGIRDDVSRVNGALAVKMLPSIEAPAQQEPERQLTTKT